jgi:hypothetical protein
VWPLGRGCSHDLLKVVIRVNETDLGDFHLHFFMAQLLASQEPAETIDNLKPATVARLQVDDQFNLDRLSQSVLLDRFDHGIKFQISAWRQIGSSNDVHEFGEHGIFAF